MSSRRLSVPLFFALLTTLCLTAEAQADSCVPIAVVPTVLLEPGGYCLTGDLTYSGPDTAILIWADDVTLDMGGFTLTGTAAPGAPSTGIEAYGPWSRTTVKNGTVTGFRHAVRIAGDGGGHSIESVRALSNWYLGLTVVGPASAIRSCQVSETGGSPNPEDWIPIGILGEGDQIEVTDNVVGEMFAPPGGEAVGIVLGGGTGARAERNVVAGTSGDTQSTFGIWTNSPGTVMSNNLVAGYAVALAFAPPSSGAFDQNLFFNVATPMATHEEDPPSAVDAGGNRSVSAPCRPIYVVPTVITKQGRYCLVRNLSYDAPSGDAILIASDYVGLDFRGFKLGGGNGGPASTAVGVHAIDRRNVLVRNGNVRGFGKGVFLEDTGSGTTARMNVVENMRLDDNLAAGIHLQGGGATVRGNQVTGGAAVDTSASEIHGIRVDGDFARVLGNEVTLPTAASSATFIGVQVTNGTGAVIERNRVDSSMASVAIRILSSTRAAVLRNRISGGQVGLWFEGSSGVFRGNLTAGVAQPYSGGTDLGGN